MTGEEFKPAVRTIQGPVAVVVRKLPYSQIPWRQVPLQERTGYLQIALQWNIEIRGDDQTSMVYPHGCTWHSRGGYSTWVEVAPRAWSADEFQNRLTRGLRHSQGLSRARIIRTQHCNVAAPVGTSYFEDYGHTHEGHVTFMPQGRLRRYLGEALPFIGVDPRDVNTVMLYMETKLAAAGREHAARLRKALAG